MAVTPIDNVAAQTVKKCVASTGSYNVIASMSYGRLGRRVVVKDRDSMKGACATLRRKSVLTDAGIRPVMGRETIHIRNERLFNLTANIWLISQFKGMTNKS
jgi:hypothetical protein